MRVTLPAPTGYHCMQAAPGGSVYAVHQHSRNGPVVGFVRQLRTYGKGGHRSRMRWFYALPADDNPTGIGKWHTHSLYTNPFPGSPGAGHATARDAVQALVDHLTAGVPREGEPF